MVADWLEQVGHGNRLVFSKWVMVADWLEQVRHGSQFVRASGL